jgi:hypothetical protein
MSMSKPIPALNPESDNELFIKQAIGVFHKTLPSIEMKEWYKKQDELDSLLHHSFSALLLHMQKFFPKYQRKDFLDVIRDLASVIIPRIYLAQLKGYEYGLRHPDQPVDWTKSAYKQIAIQCLTSGSYTAKPTSKTVKFLKSFYHEESIHDGKKALVTKDSSKWLKFHQIVNSGTNTAAALISPEIGMESVRLALGGSLWFPFNIVAAIGGYGLSLYLYNILTVFNENGIKQEINHKTINQLPRIWNSSVLIGTKASVLVFATLGVLTIPTNMFREQYAHNAVVQVTPSQIAKRN